MFQKLCKYMMAATFIVVLTAILGWFALSYIATKQAKQKAQALIEEAYKSKNPQTDDEKVIALTQEVYQNFEHVNPTTVLLLRLRPYLTSRHLPSSMRLPEGVIETLLNKGFCDNAARKLALVLKQENFSSAQWNMVTDKGGHSALLVNMSSERAVLADPFYGFVTIGEDGQLIHPQVAKESVLSGKALQTVFMPLDDKSKERFYAEMASMRMAAQGEDLVLEATLPKIDKEPVVLGEIDDSDQDLISAGKKYGMNPYWHYMGHKYNREWVRVLKAQQAVKLVMTLQQPAEKGILAATPPPKVEGKNLIWELQPGDEIIFRDGLAKISWWRLNSYIGVDQIAIYPHH